jgi:hypothetical protein
MRFTSLRTTNEAHKSGDSSARIAALVFASSRQLGAFAMRIPIIAILLTAFATGNASALSIDAKALARYDISYVECEARIPAMKGRRDEAYLNLWRIPADEKALAQLAAVRKGAPYRAERQRVLRAPASAASAASGALAQQCQGLWAETQRTATLKTDAKPDKGP